MREGMPVSVIERTLRDGDDGRDGARASRRERARMRERLRPIHADKVKCCGRWALTDRLTIVRKGDQAYVGGTMRCGRVWLCPWCSAVIGQARVEDIAEAVRRHVDGGGAVYLLTRTLRHRAGLALAAVLNVLLTARSDLVRSWAWRQETKRLGILGTIKSRGDHLARRRGAGIRTCTSWCSPSGRSVERGLRPLVAGDAGAVGGRREPARPDAAPRGPAHPPGRGRAPGRRRGRRHDRRLPHEG